MKLKTILLLGLVGPVLGLMAHQILWVIYDMARLSKYIYMPSFSNMTVAVFLGVWGVTAYKVLRPKQLPEKSKKKPEEKDVKKPKKKLRTNPLETEITIKNLAELIPSKRFKLLEFVVLGKGRNFHQVLPYDKNAEYVCGDKTFKVKEDNLCMKKPFFGKPRLVAIFNSDGTAVTAPATGKITAETLYLAKTSGALRQGLAELFATHFDMKKILFFVIIGVVGVLGYLIVSGGIHF